MPSPPRGPRQIKMGGKGSEGFCEAGPLSAGDYIEVFCRINNGDIGSRGILENSGGQTISGMTNSAQGRSRLDLFWLASESVAT